MGHQLKNYPSRLNLGKQLKLYYLTSEKWAKVALLNRRLKVSTLDELNDPFELLGADIGEPSVRRILKYAQKTISNKFGLICMSSTWQSPVMWAHYGDKHRGVCLGFDVDEQAVHKVSYQASRLKNLLSKESRLTDVKLDVLLTLFSTKSVEWSYEKECRIIVPFSQSELDYEGRRFLCFKKDAFQLSEIILGYRCKWGLKEAANFLENIQTEVSLKRVRPSFKKFIMVQQRKEPIIRVKPNF